MVLMRNCNCDNIYDQNCKDSGHAEEKRRGRQALFDYMTCVQMEEQFNKDENESFEGREND
jgi:hypothetical protein